MCVCRTKTLGSSRNGMVLATIFMFLRNLTRLKISTGNSMNYSYGNKLSLCSQGYFPATCAVSAAPFCRPILLAGVFLRTFMPVLAGIAFCLSSCCIPLAGIGDHRNYFSGAVGCKTLSQNRHLADANDISYLGAPDSFFLKRGSPVRKGINLLGAAHA